MKCRPLLASLAIALALSDRRARCVATACPVHRAACVAARRRRRRWLCSTSPLTRTRVPRRPSRPRLRCASWASAVVLRASARDAACSDVRFTRQSVSWRWGDHSALTRAGHACASSAERRRRYSLLLLVGRTARPSTTSKPVPVASATRSDAGVRPSLTAPVPTTSLTAAAFGPASFWNATIPANVALANSTRRDRRVDQQAGQPARLARSSPTVAKAATAPPTPGSTTRTSPPRSLSSPATRAPACTGSAARTRTTASLVGGRAARSRRCHRLAATYLGGGVPVTCAACPLDRQRREAISTSRTTSHPTAKHGRVVAQLGACVAIRELRRVQRRVADDTLDRHGPRAGARRRSGLEPRQRLLEDCWWAAAATRRTHTPIRTRAGRPDSQAREKSWGATADRAVAARDAGIAASSASRCHRPCSRLEVPGGDGTASSAARAARATAAAPHASRPKACA